MEYIDSQKRGVFELLAELFKKQIHNDTVHTNTLLVTITRPVHRLSKASSHSLTPVRTPQRLSKANPCSSSAETVEGQYQVHVWQNLFELHRDCRRLVHVWQPLLEFHRDCQRLVHIWQPPFQLHRDCQRLVHIWQPPFELNKDCRRLIHVWQPPFELRSDSRSLVDISEIEIIGLNVGVQMLGIQ